MKSSRCSLLRIGAAALLLHLAAADEFQPTTSRRHRRADEEEPREWSSSRTKGASGQRDRHLARQPRSVDMARDQSTIGSNTSDNASRTIYRARQHHYSVVDSKSGKTESQIHYNHYSKPSKDAKSSKVHRPSVGVPSPPTNTIGKPNGGHGEQKTGYPMRGTRKSSKAGSKASKTAKRVRSWMKPWRPNEPSTRRPNTPPPTMTPTVSEVPTVSKIPTFDLIIGPTSSPVPTMETLPPAGMCSDAGKRRCCYAKCFGRFDDDNDRRGRDPGNSKRKGTKDSLTLRQKPDWDRDLASGCASESTTAAQLCTCLHCNIDSCPACPSSEERLLEILGGHGDYDAESGLN